MPWISPEQKPGGKTSRLLLLWQEILSGKGVGRKSERGSPVLPGWRKDSTGHNRCRHGRGGGTKHKCKLRKPGDLGCPSSMPSTRSVEAFCSQVT